MSTPLVRSAAGANSAGFLSPTASVSIPAGAVVVGDLIIVTISLDSGNAANWGALSGSGWTQFMLRDAGTGAPKIRGWWKINTTTAAQTYSATFSDGTNWAQVSNWNAWQVGTFDTTTPVSFSSSTYNAAEETPIPSPAVTVAGIAESMGDYIITAFFSMWNNAQNIPAWINRPSPWLQTTNQESNGNYHSQYQVRRAFNPGTTSGTCPSANFNIDDDISRKVIFGAYVINPNRNARVGQAQARAGAGSSAAGSKTASGVGRARTAEGATSTGSKAAQGATRARLAAWSRTTGAKATSGTGLSRAVVAGTRSFGVKNGIGTGWAPNVLLGAYGGKPSEIPVFTGRPPTADPLPMLDSRYLVQNALTKEWLHTDLPLTEDQVKLTLSGPCEISGKISPEVAELKDSDGYPLLRSWGNILYFEMDGEIRAAAIIDDDSYDDQTQSLVAHGVSMYPSVIPYQGLYAVTQKDPLSVVQDLWVYVQSRQNSNLGVTITRMGTAVPESQYVGMEMKSKTTGNPAQPGEYIPVADRVYTPYTINWWDHKFCGSIINDMIKAAPADFVEQYSWNTDHSDVNKNILIAYPRIGRRRDDLSFVQGENIVEMPAIKSNPDSFATGVFAVGAGEGSAALREEFESIVPGRLRKIKTYFNQKITDRSQLKLLVAREYNESITGGYEVDDIVVDASHENAPYGSYIVGDDIPVDLYVPAYGELRIWSRITGITLAREQNLVQIELKRTDSFFYGREVES